MAKLRTNYICNSCGYQSAKPLGRCPNCQAWNSFEEEVPTASTSGKSGRGGLGGYGGVKGGKVTARNGVCIVEMP